MIAALLAEEGLGAECDALEGKAGLYALFYKGQFDESTLQDELGRKWLSLEANFKPWATSGMVNPFIEAALDLVSVRGLKPDDIRQVHLRGGRPAQHWIEPADERKRPANGAAAANSVYFAVAKALTNGGVTLGDFTPEGLRQPETIAFTDRMDHSIEDGLGHSAVVELTLQSSETVSSRVDVPLGSPAKPMSRQQIIEKFLDCARYASGPISQSRLEQAIEVVDRLERAPDVRALTALLVPDHN